MYVSYTYGACDEPQASWSSHRRCKCVGQGQFCLGTALRRFRRRTDEGGEEIGGSSVGCGAAEEVPVDGQRGLAAAAVTEAAGHSGEVGAGSEKRRGHEMA